MRTNRMLGLLFLAAAVLVAGWSTAWADMGGAAGLTVTLDPLPVDVVPATTDDSGTFALTGVPEGSYKLLIANADLSVSMAFAVSTVGKAPAMISGTVTTSPVPDVAWAVRAAVNGPLSDTTTVTNLRLVPKKWDLKAVRMGSIKAFLVGSGLDGVTKVTMTTGTGTISSVKIVPDTENPGLAAAVFQKGEVLKSLVPVGAKRGDTLVVTVGVEGAAGSLFSKDVTVILLGPK